MSAIAKEKDTVSWLLILPNRILSYTKIVKGERKDKNGKNCFFEIGFAEPHPILYKDSKR
ncbi:hypothetical protein [Prevotella sp. HCN-7019]|uniref:hypothetical protein n=1 Tax=Prevotella sp. HCN-7019 TaxID=3134668 RepID=UPI0030C200FE